MEFRSFGHSLKVMPSSVVDTVSRGLEDNVNVTSVTYEAAGPLVDSYEILTLPDLVLEQLHNNFHKAFSTIKVDIIIKGLRNKKHQVSRYGHPFMVIRYTLTNSPNLV